MWPKIWAALCRPQSLSLTDRLCRRDDLLKNYSKVDPSAAKSAWEFLYNKSETKCGHTNQQYCSGSGCTFQRRIHHFHSESTDL